MSYSSQTWKYQFMYDYFRNIEFAYEILKEINGKRIDQLTTEQYDYLQNVESLNCMVDTDNNIRKFRYNYFQEEGSIACNCLESMGICTMFLPFECIYVELVGPFDNMDRAILKCNLLNINDYVQEIKEILLSIGFRL